MRKPITKLQKQRKLSNLKKKTVAKKSLTLESKAKELKVKKKLTSKSEKSNLLLENENLKLKLRIEKMKGKRLLKESVEFDGNDFKRIVDHYITTAMWFYNMDSNTVDNLDEDNRKKAEADVKSFLSKLTPEMIADVEDIELLGHNFLLARNGTGAGFYDDDAGFKYGEEMDDIAEEFSSVNIYAHGAPEDGDSDEEYNMEYEGTFYLE